jgi:hypothetical protein
VPVPDENEFALFAHVKGKVFTSTDFNEIRLEIEAETDRLGGKKGLFIPVRSQSTSSLLVQNICNEPIT